MTLDGSFTVGSITFNSAFPYTIAPGTGGSLTLNNGTSPASIIDSGGTQTIAVPLVLTSNTSINIPNRGDSITVSGNISGPGSLTTFAQGGGTPPGVIALSGSNSYAGGTLIDGGTLQLGSANALPTGTALSLDAHDLAIRGSRHQWLFRHRQQPYSYHGPQHSGAQCGGQNHQHQRNTRHGDIYLCGQCVQPRAPSQASSATMQAQAVERPVCW